MVSRDLSNNVDSLISRLVKNVKSYEPGTIVYQYLKSQDNKISLYEVYNNNEDALFMIFLEWKT